MHAIDVLGDGNCFFRSLSVCMYGHQNSHDNIRQSVSRSIINQASSAPPSERAALLQRAEYVSTTKAWPGEDVIIATAVCLQRLLHIYVAGGSAAPLVYSPDTAPADSSPLLLAFYEPGHYRSVAIQCAKASVVQQHRVSGTERDNGSALPPSWHSGTPTSLADSRQGRTVEYSNSNLNV